MRKTVYVMVALCMPLVTVGSPAWSATTKPLTITELVAKSATYVGKVNVVGRVAAISPGKGFTLVDSTVCANCTTECLTDKNAKKIPCLWPGAAPVVKDVVLVKGVLSKTSKGFVFTADNVTKQ